MSGHGMSRYETNSLFADMEADSPLPGKDRAGPCSRVVRVAFEAGVDAEFDYLLPDSLWPVEIGRRVEVPFGRRNKSAIGFCVNIEQADPDAAPGDAPNKTKRLFKLKRSRASSTKTP